MKRDDPTARRPPIRRRTRALIVAAGLILAVLAIELGARPFVPPRRTGVEAHRVPHPTLGWVFEAGARFDNEVDGRTFEVAYNAAGFRDVDHPEAPPPGTDRVVILGDSFMEGYSVPLAESFPRLLESALREAGRSVEVINLGVGGYGTLQEALVYEQVGRRYAPAVVLLAVYLGNDVSENGEVFADTWGGGLKGRSRPYLIPGPDGDEITPIDHAAMQQRYQEALRHRRSPGARLARTSVLMRAWQSHRRDRADEDREAPVEARRQRRRYRLRFKGVHLCEMHPDFARAWEATDAILARLVADVRADGASLRVFTVPDITEIVPKVRTARLSLGKESSALCEEDSPAYPRLAQALEPLGLVALDLRPVFRTVPDDELRSLYGHDDQHWAGRAHALAARTVAADLLASEPGLGVR